MPKGPKDQKRSADVISNAVRVMQAGLIDRVWTCDEIVRLLEWVEAPLPAVQAD